MTLFREAEKGEPTRPSYVPDGVPWAFVVDGLERTVVAWVAYNGGTDDIESRVEVYDPDYPMAPWVWSPGQTWTGYPFGGASGPALALQCAALLRGEIGCGHKSPAPEPEESTPRSDTPGSAATLAVSAKSESRVAPTSPERAQQSSVMPTGEGGCNSHPGVNEAGSALSAGPSGFKARIAEALDMPADAPENELVLAAGLAREAQLTETLMGDPDDFGDELDAEDGDDRTSDAGPSGELEEDELRHLAADYRPECHWRGMPGRSCPSPLCPVHSNLAVSAAKQNARDPMRCPACGMKGGTANTLCHEGLHSPRALAFFEEHCGKENENGEETQDSLVGRADGGPVSGLAALAGTGADGAGAAVAEMLGGDSAEEPVSGHEVALSPADGPAKVFGREWTEDHDGDVFFRLEIGPLLLRSHHRNRVLLLDATEETIADAELFCTTALSALLSLIPAEQAVQAMGEETIQGIRDALRFVPEKRGSAHYKGLVLRLTEEADTAGRRERNASARATTAETARDHWQAEAESMARKETTARRRVDTVELDLNEALARAEKAEQKSAEWEGMFRRCQESEGKAQNVIAQLERQVEQAEQERDEARREIERLQVAARAILREAVTAESRKVTYNG